MLEHIFFLITTSNLDYIIDIYLFSILVIMFIISNYLQLASC